MTTKTTLTDGTRVYFISLTGLTDLSVAGTITETHPIDPGTRLPNSEFAWVLWDDGTRELDSIDNLITVAYMEDPVVSGDQWTVTDVARHLDVRESTVRAYAARHQMPRPDGRLGRTPWWRPATITEWRPR